MARDPRVVVPVALALLLMGWAFLPGLAVPLDRDEGEYAWAARQWVLGGLPYRDTFVQKPPVVLVLYAITLVGVGISPLSLHVLLLLNYAFVVGALFWAISRLRDAATGTAAAVLLGIALPSALYDPRSANTEAFMIGPVVLALGALLGPGGKGSGPKGAALAGGLWAVACLTKQVAAVHLPMFAAVLLLQRAPWRVWIAFAGGTLVPAVAALACFAAQGATADFLDAVVLHNLEYVGAPAEGDPTSMLLARLRAFSPFDVALWGLAAAGLAALVARRASRSVVILGLWIATALVAVSAGSYYRGHYLLQALPAICALAACLATSHRYVACATAALLAMLWSTSLPDEWRQAPEQQAAVRYGTTRFGLAPRLGAWLQARDRPGPLLVLAAEPQILFYAGRRAVTRYVSTDPLFGGYPTSAARQQEAKAGIERDPPAFIVLPRSGADVPMFRVSDPWLYQWVSRLVRERYRAVAYTTWSDSDVHPMPVQSGSAVDLVVYERHDG